jgi:hypothetical protein
VKLIFEVEVDGQEDEQDAIAYLNHLRVIFIKIAQLSSFAMQIETSALVNKN